MENIFLFIISLIITSSNTIPPQFTTQDASCSECHIDLLENEVVHPIAEEGCEICHETTGAEHPGEATGFKLTDSYPGLCYMCHDDKNQKENVHYPVQEGDCSGCHSPHSSSNKSLILDDFSENACLDCHYIETDDANIVHGPAGKGECQVCHDPHQTDYPGMIKKESKEMCLSCHNEDIKSDNGILKSIATVLVDGNTIHAPIANGDCIICHLPHSGDFPFLLIGAYPVQQYTEATVENFDLCFMCHDSDLMTADSTGYATNFRHGTKNLHYLHINGNRGRNCNLCHNAHGAPNSHILEETVLFGKWNMPMRLELTEQGGSCATGCHKRLEYNRTIE